jgi:tetratricopeptide (TPR) repeat protein
MWQFVGLSENEEDIDPKQFYYIPLLLGLLGMYWQFKNDYKNGLAVLALFFMTGLAIILYLNQPDPQPRERDYSYVGSFFAFSIWIGLGYAGMIELLIPKKNGQNKEFQLKILRSVIFVILLIITPINMIAKNYHSHDRTGNYVAWDYSYNMLQSCEPGGIIFTNGDNDTFPLWYLQEVEKVRTDIRIVNLSLLNTGWYIKQLRDLEPKVPINISDYQLETQLGVIKWEKQKCVLKVPQAVSEKYTSDFQKRFDYFDLNVPKEIMFEVRPTMSIPNGPSLLRVQDWMILNILAVNKWSKPVYFAVTVSKDNMLSDLQKYLRMDGLSLKIVPFRNWEISPDHLEKNLVHVYQYRGLQDSSVYYDSNIQGLIQNYRSAFLQLIEYYAHAKEMNKVNYLLNVMEMKLPGSVIPWTNKYLQIIRDSYLLAMNAAKVDSMIVMYPNEQELVLLGENLYRLDFFEAAEKIFAYIYNVNSSNIRALSILINIYEVTKNYKSAIKCLENHLNINPNDTVARQKLTYLKRLVKE